MDFSLRCNSLKCRVQLTDRAVVTTCSHIFCIPCSDSLGLSNSTGTHRLCPACQTTLNNLDDAVSTQLNPTEDYKTSVLSGLSPTTIMECAGRGLAFWSYQSTQEIVYQEYLSKTLTDKFGNLSLQMDKVVNDANAEIDNLTQKISHMQMDQDKLKAENSNLAHALREKMRKHQQTQELYDRLKRREMTAVTQSAAYDSVDEVLQSATGRYNGPQLHKTQTAFAQFPTGRFSGIGDHRRDSSIGIGGVGRMMPPPMGRSGYNHSTPGFGMAHEINATPSQHRTRLGSSIVSGLAHAHDSVHSPGLFVPIHSPASRRPLGHISANSAGRSGAGQYGLRAGMKIGSQQGL